ncbi:MAG TPA: glycosyltransferase family 4 protein [Burkholderiales bacterium]|nr:glycosyltransferase family 4 protein [Burkholderiales bacterium]
MASTSGLCSGAERLLSESRAESRGLKLALIGPLPPPAGGMANQTLQLSRLLAAEGVTVEIVQVNSPVRLFGAIKGLRAATRLVPFLASLWRAAGRVDLFHVMANSYGSWHLFAAPAVWVAKARKVPVIIAYHGGAAASFLEKSHRLIKATTNIADAIVVPSGFLREAFEKYGVITRIIPNVIDLQLFSPRRAAPSDSPHIIVTRNLEKVYDIGAALKAFARVRERHPKARMTIAGSGPERANLEAQALALHVAGAVIFTGKLSNEKMAELYASADVMLNPSRVDNMPVSILESLASAVPVVSTSVGGIPYMVEDGQTAILVPPEDAEAMAQAISGLLADRDQAQRLAAAGLELAQKFSWAEVREAWLSLYFESRREKGAARPR